MKVAMRGVGVSRCQEEEMFKCFAPSLFDSDSDADEACCIDASTEGSRLSLSASQTSLQVCIGKPITKTTSCEAFSKAHSESKKRQICNVNMPMKEDLQEASSPSSQGNSSVFSLSPFQASTLESCDSLDNSSPFCSVLSFESSDSVYEFDSSTSFTEGHSASKKQKVDGVTRDTNRLLPSCSHSDMLVTHQVSPQKVELPACNSITSARSLPTQNRMSPPLMSRGSAPIPSSPPYLNATISGGITTGIPVDSCPTEMNKLWAAPQVMVPMQPLNTFYPHQYHTNQAPVAPPTTPERVFAALAEIEKSTTVKPPIGLKLDTSSFSLSLKGIGMFLIDEL